MSSGNLIELNEQRFSRVYMCGIVGLFFKNPKFNRKLGSYLGEMLVRMSDRGPDSAGLAVYSEQTNCAVKLTLRFDIPELAKELELNLSNKLISKFSVRLRGSHVVLEFLKEDYEKVLEVLSSFQNPPRILSEGSKIEIFKEVGPPKEFVDQFKFHDFEGTHGIGHTRMATESAVTTMGAHPFSTGSDQCLVHNGSLSNHNSVRRKLIQDGVQFETNNDSEVAACYLTQKMSSGLTLRSALTESLDDLDGFFTFVVATSRGFGVLRDRIACKPAVLAETNDYVAFGSEYRALTDLPDIDVAKVWEPEPAKVYFWEHSDESFRFR